MTGVALQIAESRIISVIVIVWLPVPHPTIFPAMTRNALLFHILVQIVLLSGTQEKKVTLQKTEGLGGIWGCQAPLPFAASMLPDPSRSIQIHVI